LVTYLFDCTPADTRINIARIEIAHARQLYQTTGTLVDIRDTDTLLEHLIRIKLVLKDVVKLADLKVGGKTNNAYSVSYDIRRFTSMFCQRGLGGLQMTTPSYNKDAEIQRRTLHRNISGTESQMAERQQMSASTSLFNDKCYHQHRLKFKKKVFKGTPVYAAYDEGSKKKQIAVVGHVGCTFKGKALTEWQGHIGSIEQHTKPVAHKKKKGRRQRKDTGPIAPQAALSAGDISRSVQRFRALLPTKYATDKSGFGVGDLVLESLGEVGIDRENPTLCIVVVDGASTNTGRRLGSVERLRQQLDQPLISMLRCHPHVLACSFKKMTATAGPMQRQSIARRTTAHEHANMDRMVGLLEDAAALVKRHAELQALLESYKLYDTRAPAGCTSR
jgi:hypothetical protein